MSNQSDSLRVGGADRDLTRFVVTFDAPMRNLAQVSRTLSALDELWCVAVESTLIERSLATAARNIDCKWTKAWFDQSPLERLPAGKSFSLRSHTGRSLGSLGAEQFELTVKARLVNDG